MEKPVSKQRGTGLYYEDSSFEFRPQETGTPRYESSIKTTGGGSLSKTTGSGPEKKDQKFVAHLSVSADDADPSASLHDQLERLCLKSWPERKEQPEGFSQQGRVLMKNDEARAVLNQRQAVLSYSLRINLNEGDCDYQKRIINHLTQLAQCLYINKDLLIRAVRAQRKPSRQ